MKVSVIFLMFLFSTSDMSCAAATQTVWAGSHLGTAPTSTPSLREPLTLGFLSLPQLLSSSHATVSHTGTCTVLAEQGRDLSPLYMEPKMFAFSFLKPSSAGHICPVPISHSSPKEGKRVKLSSCQLPP